MKNFKGTLRNLPPDKSISHRTGLIGAIASGVTEIENYSGGLDNQTTLSVLKALGIDVRQEVTQCDGHEKRKVVISSGGLWSLKPPSADLNCNNSGSTIRMLSGILAGQPFRTRLVGDESLMKRPMRRIAEPLMRMGAEVHLSESGTPPVEITGTKSLKPISFEQKVPSAQVKSLVIFAALHATGRSEILEPIETRNHTELMLGLLPEVLENGARKIVIDGPKPILAKPFSVPADPSAACFIVALGLLAGKSDIRLTDVGLNPTRAGYLDVLKDAGAMLRSENVRTVGGELIGDILISNTSLQQPLRLSGSELVAGLIDELPMLSVLSAVATGEFELHDAAELRTKESDRIRALVINLEKLGFECEEYPDGFRVKSRQSVPTGKITIETFWDHRIAMSFAIAGYFEKAEICLDDKDAIAVSFPNFFEVIESLRA
jgi:3-phosphoshikimate 1-carboxyvinyltransferase